MAGAFSDLFAFGIYKDMQPGQIDEVDRPLSGGVEKSFFET